MTTDQMTSQTQIKGLNLIELFADQLRRYRRQLRVADRRVQVEGPASLVYDGVISKAGKVLSGQFKGSGRRMPWENVEF